MIRNIAVLARLAMDGYNWDESKHPRADNGQFGSGGGGGGGTPGNGATNNKPAQVSSTLTGVFTQAGFKKQKQPGANGTVVYFHPASGAKVMVHPAPAGKKWSSKWTHEAEGKSTAGEGSSLSKLLGVAVAKATEKKAEGKSGADIAKQTVAMHNTLEAAGWKEYTDPYNSGGYSTYKNENSSAVFSVNNSNSDWKKIMPNGTVIPGSGLITLQEKLGQKPAESKPLSEAQNAELKATETLLQEKGYKAADLDGNSVIYQKDNAKVKIDTVNGDWVAVTPGHATKEGKGLPDLKNLFDGKITGTTKNSSKTVQTAAEKAAMSESQKKAAEAHAKAVAAENKKTALYSKLKNQAPQPTASQQNAISKYSGSGYSSWNDKLRHDPHFAKTDPLTKHLDDYLHSSVFEEEVVLNRKVDGEYAKILKSIIFEGTKFIDRGYVSSSTNPNSWSGSFKFMITCPKGTKGAAIGKWSQHPSEQEVLLPRGSAFVVTKWDHDSNTVHVTLDQSHFEQAAQQKEAA